MLLPAVSCEWIVHYWSTLLPGLSFRNLSLFSALIVPVRPLESCTLIIPAAGGGILPPCPPWPVILLYALAASGETRLGMSFPVTRLKDSFCSLKRAEPVSANLL